MTRINANIPPANLTDQHLAAEHREIVRVCGKYEKRLAKGDNYIKQTHSFCLGSGHELFFIDKGLFTLKRYKALHAECLRRGLNVQDFSHAWNVYKDRHLVDYQFTEAENDIIRQRIADRLRDSKQIPRYNKQSITVEQAISLVNQITPVNESPEILLALEII